MIFTPILATGKNGFGEKLPACDDTASIMTLTVTSNNIFRNGLIFLLEKKLQTKIYD